MRTTVLDPVGAPLLATLIPDVTVTEAERNPAGLLLTAHTCSASASGPHCGVASTRIHSYYSRQPHDLPISGLPVRLFLYVRRFRCLHPTCPAVTFSEPLPALVAPAAQRTARLNQALGELALAFGGEPGARQSARSAMPASGDTLLRRAHAATPPAHPTPRVVGIDGFAFEKGRVYGTILVDGETHAVVDRSLEYARGVSAGAPDAIQIADRWHVLGNLREALERLLDRLRPQLLVLPRVGDGSLPLSSTDRDRRRGTLDQRRQQASRERRYARYAEVKRLQAENKAIIQIAWIATPLSARWQRVAIQHAAGTARSWRSNHDRAKREHLEDCAHYAQLQNPRHPAPTWKEKKGVARLPSLTNGRLARHVRQEINRVVNLFYADHPGLSGGV